MDITKEELRQIVREELERAITIVLDAKSTATAIEKGVYYSDGSRCPVQRSAMSGEQMSRH